MKWQRRARFGIAVIALAFAAVVAFAFRGRPPSAIPPAVPRSDPNAIVESASGQTIRINRSREEVRIQFGRLLTYQDGSTKMIDVKVVTQRAGGRTFTLTGREGQAGKDETSVTLNGNVELVTDDGLLMRTESASYADQDGTVRAPGPVSLSKGRMSGQGLGLTYDKNNEIVTIPAEPVIRIAPDESGAGAVEIVSAFAMMNRRDNTIRFERAVKAVRPSETIESDYALAHLSAKEDRLEAVDLRGNARITGSRSEAGTLRAMTATDMDLKYAPDGQALRQALLSGGAMIRLAGAPGQAGREITAATIDVGLADDGATPVSLVAQPGVRLLLPAEAGGATRSIQAQSLTSTGEAGKGLSRAHFADSVQFQERGPGVERTARSGLLDVSLAPGFGTMEQATFRHAVTFVSGATTAESAIARYDVSKGSLDLTPESGPPPHVENDRLTVDAPHIELVFDGPVVKASGGVKSTLQPPKPGATPTADTTKVPSMFKSDQLVNVTARDLVYDGAISRAVYSGDVQLWQGDTSIKGSTLTLDDKSGDLMAAGPVTTTATLLQAGKDGQKERVRSIATSKNFAYEEASRRGTYTGDAHVIGPQGDMTAPKVELYFKASGDELERVEGYDGVTLREQKGRTDGTRMSYFSADERYLVTGTPVRIVDQCARETSGRTLTFFKATDRVIVDGSEQLRTQTKSGSNCK